LRQRRSEPAVEPAAGATTVTSCVASLVSSSWFASVAGHADARPRSPAVNVRVVPEVVAVFRRLYAARFPIRRLRPIDAYRGNDERSLAADNTAGFNCRYVIGPGPRRWSSHAFGEAIDVNPVENPYLERGRVHPRAGRAYLDRSHLRPGMAVRGGVLVRSFATAGWQWGGRWTGSPDYQHFSATGG
jgi:D-alanyl-D-alanine carboxypeptidase